MNKISEKAVWDDLAPSQDEMISPTSFGQPTQPQMMFCYKCNQVIPANSAFCPWCQIELYATCPKCGNKYSSQYPACNQCGTNKKEYLLTHSILAVQKKKEQEEKQRQKKIKEEERRRKRPQILEFYYVEYKDSIKLIWKTQNAKSCYLSMRRSDKRDWYSVTGKRFNFSANGGAIVNLDIVTDIAKWFGVSLIEVKIEAMNEEEVGDERTLFINAICPKLGFAKTKIW